jgi:hypothetical protein
VRILEDVAYREIRDDVGMHEDGKGERDQAELHEGGVRRQVHQRTAACGGADQRHDALDRGDEQRQDECEVADFYEHAITGRPALLIMQGKYGKDAELRRGNARFFKAVGTGAGGGLLQIRNNGP